MSPEVSQSSQSHLHLSQSALSPSSPPVQSSYSHSPAVIESLQSGPAPRQDNSPPVPRSLFVHPAGQGDLADQSQGFRNPLERRNAGPPEPSLPLGSTSPAQDIANPPDFSQTRGHPYPRDNMTPYPIAMGQEAYLSGQIPQVPNIWPSRPSTTMDQTFPQSQLVSSGYIGYNLPGPAQGYYQPGCSSAQYHSTQGQHLNGTSTAYAYPSNSISSPSLLADQPFVSSSPNYMLNQQDYSFPETSSHPSTQNSQPVSPQLQPPPQPQTMYSSPEPTSSTAEHDQPERMNSSRRRPQCWDHGCNGREFSTFSNLLRHQREKSGAVAKAECPSCGAVFTRSTARNIHVAQGKCKGGIGIERY